MILVFGSVNLDIIHTVPTLPKPGETVIGTTLRLEPGGKGANQAVAASRDGARVAFAGAVGPDAAAALTGLVAAGVDLSRLKRTTEPTGIASICVDPAGQNQIAVSSGANRLAKASQVSDDDLGPATILVLQMELDPAETAALIRRARRFGSRIILNLAPAAPLQADALALVDWLVMNEEEALWLGPAPLPATVGVIRTLGAQGVAVTMASGTLQIPGIIVHAIDATGAGDCFTGVFAAGLDRGDDPRSAIQRANTAASLSCTRRGCQSSYPNGHETLGRLEQP